MTVLTFFACDTLPETPERKKVLSEALKDQSDRKQAREFAALVLDGLDQTSTASSLAETATAPPSRADRTSAEV